MLQSFLTKIHGWYVAFSYAVASGILLTGFCSASYDERSPNIATLTDVKYHQRFGHFRGSRDWLDRCSDEEYASYHGHFRDESYEVIIRIPPDSVLTQATLPCVGVRARSKKNFVGGFRECRLFTLILQAYLSTKYSEFDEKIEIDIPCFTQELDKIFFDHQLPPNEVLTIKYAGDYYRKCFKEQQDSGKYIWVYSAQQSKAK